MLIWFLFENLEGLGVFGPLLGSLIVMLLSCLPARGNGHPGLAGTTYQGGKA